MFSNVESNSLHRGLIGGRTESPPATLLGTGGTNEFDLSGVGGPGNTSTFRRRGRQQQQRTASVNPMRGSMFQLNTVSTMPSASITAASLDLESRYGYGTKKSSMTPGPGRRAPVSWRSYSFNPSPL